MKSPSSAADSVRNHQHSNASAPLAAVPRVVIRQQPAPLVSRDGVVAAKSDERQLECEHGRALGVVGPGAVRQPERAYRVRQIVRSRERPQCRVEGAAIERVSQGLDVGRHDTRGGGAALGAGAIGAVGSGAGADVGELRTSRHASAP